MSQVNDGGPAFPTDHSKDASYTDIKGGMSLRDYFAAQAVSMWRFHGPTLTAEDCTMLAQVVYGIADAMLVERTKQPEAV